MPQRLNRIEPIIVALAATLGWVVSRLFRIFGLG